MALLTIENMSKSFYLHATKKTISSCRNIGFSLNEGEFIGIVGRSGAGKSTILKCINRTYLPLEGSIYYDSRAFGRINLAYASEREMLWLRRYEIGYVSQFLNVMPRTTAKEHVMSALLETGASADEADAAAKQMLSYFRLPENLWDIYPNTFSGGDACV
jgi:alpha-D-ribose 1-methylphosphonate 5-triphosphate synthase subunit PhnL